jgi:two-component system sensor histidine kinase KdpD
MSNARVRLLRAAVSLAAVAVVTGLVYALKPVAPVLSLGVLYVIAVVVVAVLYGLAYAIPVSIASMLVFNFLFLPPLHTFALRDSANWVALSVYLVTAVIVSELATRSRRLANKAVEAETLRQSETAKTAILRAVGHDLRTPLTAIRAAADGLASADLELSADDRTELIETMRGETRRLERLVSNLLELSRLEVGVAQGHPALWPADALVAQALEQLGPAGDRIVVHERDDVPAVRVDAVQIERALANLLENALAVTPADEPVELEVEEQRGRVRLLVRDHGPGVRDEDRERIFQPFERGRGGRGTGLGLAIARGFAEANGGTIGIHANEGGGSVFALELPAAERRVAVPA